MRHTLRKLFDAGVGLVPPFLVTGFLKAFATHPEFAERAGFQVYPRVFYNPFPDPAEVDVKKLREKRSLPGVDLDVTTAQELLASLSKYSGELEQFPRDPKNGSIVWNTTYPDYDTAALYTMIRHLKPKRYREIGCGYSSRVSTAAILRNRAEGFDCQAVYIEPYPRKDLVTADLAGEFIKKKVQEVPLQLFEELESGDMLFIDTSHIIKVQNDVEYELIHILPSLKVGVYVHIHDIFTPYDYPEELLVGNGTNRGANNEQYALECLLSGGDDWETVLPLYFLWKDCRPCLNQLLVDAKDRPVAFYIRRKHFRSRTKPAADRCAE
ncbi:MAG: hypothetical protein JWR69_831 [Pedosphaera sp.]|nr:hypothetical protein [Pedosphaera sp.]